MKKLLIFLFFSTFFITGCVSFGNSKVDKTAGVFMSFDNGDTWTSRSLFLHSGGAASISGVNVTNLTFDPQDAKAVYITSNNDGLLYSYDGANSWRKADQITNGDVKDMAVDSQNKCVVYVTAANTILKSVDCNRSWVEIYIDTRADKIVTALAVDHFNNLNIYAGNSSGDILKSTDGGLTWRVVDRLDNSIQKIIVDPFDSRVVYVATQSRGIFKTTSGGADWFEVNEGLKPYSGSLEFKDLVYDKSTKDFLILVSKYGLIKTVDGGNAWEVINLITPPATTNIYSLAISPFNSDDIYYSTASTFYRTSDGGLNWITKRLPSNAVGTELQVDPANAGVLYLGMSNLDK